MKAIICQNTPSVAIRNSYKIPSYLLSYRSHFWQAHAGVRSNRLVMLSWCNKYNKSRIQVGSTRMSKQHWFGFFAFPVLGDHWSPGAVHHVQHQTDIATSRGYIHLSESHGKNSAEKVLPSTCSTCNARMPHIATLCIRTLIWTRRLWRYHTLEPLP